MNEFKSKEEEYFSYYLEELKEAGFIKKWYYETDTWTLSKKATLEYLKQLKTKVKKEEEFLLHPSSITADFTIIWDISAENIFYLYGFKPIKDVKEIPFRLMKPISNCSYIEVKGITTFKTNTSDISFPYKQKFLYALYEVYIQKVKPFTPNNKPSCLFSETFTPMKVIQEEVYKVKIKGHQKGESKLKYQVRTLNEFLKTKEI